MRSPLTTNKIKLSPSLLAADFLDLNSELDALNQIETPMWIHLDVMDSHFVPNLTFGLPALKQIASKMKASKHRIDVHLMVSNPSFFINELKNCNIFNLTFHYEAVPLNALEVALEAKKYFKSVGIAIKPKTDVALLSRELLNDIDLLLIMSVEPGFCGQKFIDNVLDKTHYINQIKAQNNNPIGPLILQMDGGICAENIEQVIKNGITNIVLGSYFFNKLLSKNDNDINKYKLVFDKIQKSLHVRNL